jgi:hypothetical protein
MVVGERKDRRARKTRKAREGVERVGVGERVNARSEEIDRVW